MQPGGHSLQIPKTNPHKNLSKDTWYLFITTSVFDFGLLLVLTDWSFPVLAPSHRWHLHLSWPKRWGGEDALTMNNTSQSCKNNSEMLCLQHCVPFDKSLPNYFNASYSSFSFHVLFSPTPFYLLEPWGHLDGPFLFIPEVRIKYDEAVFHIQAATKLENLSDTAYTILLTF